MSGIWGCWTVARLPFVQYPCPGEADNYHPAPKQGLYPLLGVAAQHGCTGHNRSEMPLGVAVLPTFEAALAAAAPEAAFVEEWGYVVCSQLFSPFRQILAWAHIP